MEGWQHEVRLHSRSAQKITPRCFIVPYLSEYLRNDCIADRRNVHRRANEPFLQRSDAQYRVYNRITVTIHDATDYQRQYGIDKLIHPSFPPSWCESLFILFPIRPQIMKSKWYKNSKKRTKNGPFFINIALINGEEYKLSYSKQSIKHWLHHYLQNGTPWYAQLAVGNVPSVPSQARTQGSGKQLAKPRWTMYQKSCRAIRNMLS